MRIGIYVATAAQWDERRRVPLNRLCQQIAAQLAAPGCRQEGVEEIFLSVVHSPVKEHAREWSRRLYRAALDRQCSHPVLLNDDIVLHERFVEMVQAMLRAVPDQVISLHSSCAIPKGYGGAWLRSYNLSGPGYIYPRADLQDLVLFTEAMPEHSTAWRTHNEDGVAALHAWARQKPIWQTIPALVEHDTDVPSTLGYDNHPMRRADNGWRTKSAETLERMTTTEHWTVTDPPPMVPHPWFHESAMKAQVRALREGADHMVCVFCKERDGTHESGKTGAKLCDTCAEQVSKAHAEKHARSKGPATRLPGRPALLKVGEPPNTFDFMVPSDMAQKAANIFSSGYYDVPALPDVPPVRRILDLGAGPGIFAYYAWLRWQGSWLEAWEKDADAARYLRQNTPPGTIVHEKTIPAAVDLPPADLVHMGCGLGQDMLTNYPHWSGVNVLILETHGEHSHRNELHDETGLRLFRSLHLNPSRGIDVYVRSAARVGDGGKWVLPTEA